LSFTPSVGYKDASATGVPTERCARIHVHGRERSRPWIQADFENGIYPGSGPSYNASNTGNNAAFVIGVLSTGGHADAAAQDAFCANTTCTVSKIYDQSGYGPMHQEGAIILGPAVTVHTSASGPSSKEL
jgi:hypothetical protein